MSRPLDPDLIARYMSPGAAQGVFGQRLTDAPAYVSGGSFEQLGKWKVPTREEELSEAWDSLRRAECEGEQRSAVMDLSEMIFGDPPPPPLRTRRLRQHRAFGGELIAVTQEDF